MNGVCSGGSASASVACGATTCAAGQACCINFGSTPFCTTKPDACDIAASCDGVADCGGNACCEAVFDFVASCSSNTTCQGAGPGADQVCRDTTDCTDPTAKMCCFGVGLPGEPWGRCRPSC